ncbi:UDP-N-acetylenolpyruvoylglucosamine reductase [Candidatus Daviesbacteria bacterium RIFCSPHIGHO2_01_FULL_44_29]|uniref:UDP-N-acetylenolpyruvoylglucosamine reductase n=1 Tax=Candidatus Daviesbacteria bacterium RIFCSPHIGHO2_02_FULL_43_12 TaxID=1797776 RepID=A0A1F5KGN5_9BACT|nr:MAG: UDP-N-acetylenolpyruvoylglucosamine reductase [Candidatus Daviesbacteria bacterium RIFCSPHIGHO2_01_FULL_44_29]OGE40097.1 MAG: UDP-N-acetylenolpyruvoylglucosamine reductase [Candidatus Daviesbacteria bacterium RIFCSPHIGHO2_02_FULL_43_12]OGE41045.1 MAG: UDP-N-acetylenolpyruvoylglucosamine reductase [Candidatus Daviesbacteria bacterium RIFCSPHIGHO2_12_FULL_47_45]OGE70223.1 MAG: UDP-N-acetylenolpyruvoylglucosamine reductase [Candidatus Daviesbacteria bacterium RIFCSPLOWO2_01_FULL_43_15]
MLDEYLKILHNEFSELETDKSFRELTTVEIGGPAKAFLEVKSSEELVKALIVVKTHSIPYFVIGGGSNLLVSDQGVDKLVIKVATRSIVVEEGLVRAQAGTSLQELVDFSIKNSLTGIQKMTGIPGTIGGAIYGNAGAYGQMIGDHLEFVSAYDLEKQEVVILTREECGFEYRSSAFKTNGCVILDATFKFSPGDKESLSRESSEVLAMRLKKYKPGLKCPGSFFRNLFTSEVPKSALEKLPPREDTYGKTPAYVFIEALGLKGRRVGDVEITDFHGNLFVNLGNGTAQDFWDLAHLCYQQVKDRFGVELHPEVQLVGLPSISSEFTVHSSPRLYRGSR